MLEVLCGKYVLSILCTQELVLVRSVFGLMNQSLCFPHFFRYRRSVGVILVRAIRNIQAVFPANIC